MKVSTLSKPLDSAREISILPLYAPPETGDYVASEVPCVIRHGAWEAELLCCLDTNFGALVNACMGWCLPCVSLAQVSQRLGNTKYWLMHLAVGILIALQYLTDQTIESEKHSSSFMWRLTDTTINAIYTATTGDKLHVENRYLQDTAIGIYIAYGMWALVGMAPVIAMSLMTWALRVQTRARFGIRGSCCRALSWHLQIPQAHGCNIGPVDTIPAFQPLR